ncbi:MAG: preprotein translocase subunit TatB [Firmicutes bacterium HGW-Firmicutes-13]|nr:MAG: preprotein translocase subunit TatB [Firmicutes bacterium HGW-Firmicutes-13]
MSENKYFIDARGRNCPEPVLLTRKALNSFSGEKIEVAVDSPTARENVIRMVKNKGYKISVEEKEGEYYLTITR